MRRESPASVAGPDAPCILLQFQPVELDAVPGLAEFVPGRLLVLVEVFQIAVAVREVEQIVFALVKPFDELVRLITGCNDLMMAKPSLISSWPG